MTEWADIEGHKGYQISVNGEVRSVDREVMSKGAKRPRRLSGRVLKQFKNSEGYMQVSLGRSGYARVHKLVAETFLGACPDGQLVRHLDGNPSNNHLTNLAYGTPRENYEDSIKHGIAKFGEDHHTAKISDAAVGRIRKLHENGASQAELSRQFDVHRSTISRIVREQARELR